MYEYALKYVHIICLIVFVYFCIRTPCYLVYLAPASYLLKRTSYSLALIISLDFVDYYVNVRMLKVKVWFYIALYPVRWTAQSALHFPPLADLFIPTPFSASLGSILAMQQLRNDYSLTFTPLSIARYSFIQLSRLRRR